MASPSATAAPTALTLVQAGLQALDANGQPIGPILTAPLPQVLSGNVRTQPLAVAAARSPAARSASPGARSPGARSPAARSASRSPSPAARSASPPPTAAILPTLAAAASPAARSASPLARTPGAASPRAGAAIPDLPTAGAPAPLLLPDIIPAPAGPFTPGIQDIFPTTVAPLPSGLPTGLPGLPSGQSVALPQAHTLPALAASASTLPALPSSPPARLPSPAASLPAASVPLPALAPAATLPALPGSPVRPASPLPALTPAATLPALPSSPAPRLPSPPMAALPPASALPGAAAALTLPAPVVPAGPAVVTADYQDVPRLTQMYISILVNRALVDAAKAGTILPGTGPAGGLLARVNEQLAAKQLSSAAAVLSNHLVNLAAAKLGSRAITPWDVAAALDADASAVLGQAAAETIPFVIEYVSAGKRVVVTYPLPANYFRGVMYGQQVYAKDKDLGADQVPLRIAMAAVAKPDALAGQEAVIGGLAMIDNDQTAPAWAAVEALYNARSKLAADPLYYGKSKLSGENIIFGSGFLNGLRGVGTFLGYATPDQQLEFQLNAFAVRPDGVQLPASRNPDKSWTVVDPRKVD